ncbi:hypothetical protein ABID82_005039 [Methylobacterium sp. PvP062]|uniref:Uncharacterized protein n=1 Tax=Methylobacterium radiotolerans TaxID=31998 RepID=A0ABV2NUK7_9HYPH|nr:hypothetical protein [Methylobacterium sp. PvP105]MBP2505737.1 hypothetical protein [Methylobacterium sp. PvP109]
MEKKSPKCRNPNAKVLARPIFRQRVITKKTYQRKPRTPSGASDAFNLW